MNDIAVDTKKHGEVVIVSAFYLYHRCPKDVLVLFELSRRIFRETDVLAVSPGNKRNMLHVTFHADIRKEALFEQIDKVINIMAEVYGVQIQKRLF